MTKQLDIALERFGLRGARARRLRQGFVRIFRVTCPVRGEFCLRMYDLLPPAAEEATELLEAPPPGRPSPEQLRAQLQWLSALSRETALPVPEPVPASDGSLAPFVHFGGATNPVRPGRRVRLCVLLRWVAGRHKKEGLSPTELSALGSFVGGLHNHAARYAPPGPCAPPRWDWGWPFGESAPLWGEGERFYSAEEMAVFEEAARRVREDLRELGYGGDAFGPIHRDLHLGNVVFDGARVGAVDFDSCGLGHYLLDLAVVLNALRIRHPNRFEAMRGALLEGYERERALPEGYRGYLMTFHAMRYVSRVNRELRALGSETNRHRARGDAVLRTALTWLQSKYLKD